MNKLFKKTELSLKNSKKVFIPNLTSQLSYEVAFKNIKKNNKFLDLGCGNGILGIALFKSKKIKKVYASDVSKDAIKIAKINFVNNKVKFDLRLGNLFKPWWGISSEKEKFDYILNDVSAISSLLAKKSTWFGKNIPCAAGKDGSKLSINIIKNSKFFLKKNGSLQIPILSLSNRKKILKTAKENFSIVRIALSKEWFLPKEMLKLRKTLVKYKLKRYINYQIKFNNLICKTEIIICRKFK